MNPGKRGRETESKNMNHGVSKLLVLTEQRRHWWNLTRDTGSEWLSKMGFNSLTCHYGSSSTQWSCGFSSSRWLTSCSRPRPFWTTCSSNPSSHPAARQPWTNMELTREIQSEYKQVMFQMNNTLSIPACTCSNNNSHVFLSLNWELLFAWFLSAADNTLTHWLFELHIIMYIVSHLWPVWAVSV